MSQGTVVSQAPITSAKASLREVARRRSERLLIAVPIRVDGIDYYGQPFSEETHTLNINREGARIRLRRKVPVGAQLKINIPLGRRSAMFRVVGPTQPMSGEGGEWGLECLEPNCTIWGINFPPPSPVESSCAALLECRRCRAVKLTPLSLVEHEVLGTTGLLVKECESCGRSTSWSYRESYVPFAEDDPRGALLFAENSHPQAPASYHRRHERVALHLPVRVRSFSGEEEFSRTDNVSRGGFCFTSDHVYEIGEIVLVTCPYEKGGHNIEIRAHMVRRRDQGPGRWIFGLSYER